jgi:hypothetical protein
MEIISQIQSRTIIGNLQLRLKRFGRAGYGLTSFGFYPDAVRCRGNFKAGPQPLQIWCRVNGTLAGSSANWMT